MGLSELMRMIIIFVTFCLNKKKKKEVLRNQVVYPHHLYTEQGRKPK